MIKHLGSKASLHNVESDIALDVLALTMRLFSFIVYEHSLLSFLHKNQYLERLYFTKTSYMIKILHMDKTETHKHTALP